MTVFSDSELVVDAVLVASQYAFKGPTSTRATTSFRSSHHLHGDVWLAVLPPDLSEQIADACTAAGLAFAPKRQYGFPYAFIRHQAPATSLYQFDPDGALMAAVSLSRLVHPTSAGFRYAARLLIESSGTIRIVPATVLTLNRHAFVLDPSSDWLVPDDVSAIQDLCAAYHSRAHPKRVLSALWQREFAARSHFIDQRLPAIVTGLEALVHIRGEMDPKDPRRHAGSTRVFRQRCAALANRLSISNASESELDAIYDLRSDIVHGSGVADLAEPTRTRVETAERLLSRTLRSALLDPAFGSIFATDSSLQKALPLT